MNEKYLVKFEFYNYSFFKIDLNGNKYYERKLSKEFGYYVPNKQFIPSVANGWWDGFKSFYNARKQLLPIGVIRDAYQFLTDLGCTVQVDKRYYFKEEDYSFLYDIQLYSKGKEIIVRDNQFEAIQRAVSLSRCINICPTSFGKSACIYLVCRFHIHYGRKNIIVVPTKALVDQMINDFIDYGYDGEINGIYSGKEIKSTDITVTTFQTLVKNLSLLKDFENIIIDECHRAKSNSIVKILENAVNCSYRSGWTGTLEKNSLDRLTATTYIGPEKVITDTKSLMDNKIVANLKIKSVELVHKGIGKLEYKEELQYLREHEGRNQYIVDLALSLNKTGIVATKSVEQCEFLYNEIRKKDKDRYVYQIRGGLIERNGVPYRSLEDVKSLIENEENSILVVTLQVFSTGISLKNVHFLIMASSTKSYNTVIQSIGRGLRVNEQKKDFVFYDLYDNITTDCYSKSHFSLREDYYKQQQFIVEKEIKQLG